MTVESNRVIVLVSVLVGFLIGSKKWRVITLPIRNKRVIGVDLTGRSKLSIKSKCGFGLCHAILFSK